MPALVRLLAGTVVLTAAYFVVPVHADRNVWVRGALTVAGFVLVTVLIVRPLRRPGAAVGRLALAITGGVLVFALTDYIIAVQAGQFDGLHTRLDALYFAMATLATVGYGDVHADGQLARAVVAFQMVFNIVVIATAASVLVGRIKARARGPQ